MGDPALDLKNDPLAIEGLEEVYDVYGAESGTSEGPPGAISNDNPGQPGHLTIEADNVLTYLPTSEASLIAGVDSRTIRRWYEQKKVRGHLNKGKLLIAREDLPHVDNSLDAIAAGTPGAESGAPEESPGTISNGDPGQPGQSADMPQTPAVAFSDFLDRIERLSRENGELRAMLDEQRRENEELKLLTDSRQQKPRGNYWQRFSAWCLGRTNEVP